MSYAVSSVTATHSSFTADSHCLRTKYSFDELHNAFSERNKETSKEALICSNFSLAHGAVARDNVQHFTF